MRFTRDKRGYETTALVTTGGGRRRGRGQRLLYFFRTPPGVRVGRAPIDEDAIRLLEEHNPDVQFDWTRILKQPPPAGSHASESRRADENREPRRTDERRDARRSEHNREVGRDGVRGAGREPRRDRPPASPPAAGSERLPSSATVPASARSEPEFAGPSESSELTESEEFAVRAEPREFVEPVEPAGREEPGEFVEPEPDVRGEAEPLEAGEPVEPDTREVPARYARLGAEGLARLRARYAEMMARITEKSLDAHATEELRTKAERLNPDAWVTEAEVAAALEQYETVFEDLRPVVGRHPRGRRRRRV